MLGGAFVLDVIRKCFEDGNVASFFCNPDYTDLHLTGYVAKYSADEVLIAHISVHGYYDGFILKPVKDIYRIDYAGNYETKIARLYKQRKQGHPNLGGIGDGEIMPSLFSYAKDNSLIICLEFQDNLLRGFVNNYNDNTICINIIDDYGCDDGISVINLEDILTVSVDTDDEQAALLLYKANQTN